MNKEDGVLINGVGGGEVGGWRVLECMGVFGRLCESFGMHGGLLGVLERFEDLGESSKVRESSEALGSFGEFWSAWKCLGEFLEVLRTWESLRDLGALWGV